MSDGRRVIEWQESQGVPSSIVTLLGGASTEGGGVSEVDVQTAYGRFRAWTNFIGGQSARYCWHVAVVALRRSFEVVGRPRRIGDRREAELERR